MKYFKGSIIFTIFALALCGAIGWVYGGVAMMVSYLISAALLGVLETCVSVDNAVVNATVLRYMDAKWVHRFLTWGMAIAVFGMRLVFPIAIVSVAAHVSPWHALDLALFKPAEYQAAVVSAHTQIMGFGGTFLMMVFLKFFLDSNKEEHWISFIEKRLVSIGKIESVQAALAIVALLCLSPLMHEPEKFFTSGLIGIVAYILVDGIGAFLEDDAEPATSVNFATQQVVKSGIASFIYLEVVDASFSFDGVIAAFAITNNFLIIALGLGIGAMFVRSLTLMMVEKGTLDQFAYLEHGAFYAIGYLVVIMFLAAAGIELGEAVAAIGSLLVIGSAVGHSMWVKRQEERLENSTFTTGSKDAGDELPAGRCPYGHG